MSETLDSTRFKACERASRLYNYCFGRYGREYTSQKARGESEAAAGALCSIEGEAAAFHFYQTIADNIALRMIDASKREL